MAKLLNNLATAERLSGDFAAAEGNYHEALRIARTLGQVEREASYLGNLSELALTQKNWQKAETLAVESLLVSEKVGHLELVARASHRLAKALVRQEKPAKALPYAQRAVEIYTRLGSPDIEYARATLAECEA